MFVGFISGSSENLFQRPLVTLNMIACHLKDSYFFFYLLQHLGGSTPEDLITCQILACVRLTGF